MREIKFRAWDETKKKMFVPNHIDGYGTLVVDERHDNGDGTFGTHPIEYPNPYVLMQFTGLHDKNGKEIYEGDIISKASAFVVWSERLACWCFTFKPDEGKNQEVPLFYEKTGKTWDHFEVIGNTYENPELLNQ